MAATTGPEASSSMSQYTYHAFLSFRGEDTRKNFTDHLYTALKWAGINTFRDDDCIERGENIELEIEKAIKESKISIIVFSKDYASSRWCLDELVMIMERRKNVGHTVLPVFYTVDPSHVSEQTGSFAKAFTCHYEHFKDEISRVEAWRAALREVTGLAGMVLQDGYEAQFVQDIVRKVGDKLKRTILHVPFYLVGIDSRVKDINLWLQDGMDDVAIAMIYGIGGVGKTTIAKILFNLNFNRFDGWSFLRGVREASEQPNGLVQLQRQLLSDILRGKENKIHNVDEGIIKIKHAIWNKRVLIVLDDVDQLDQFTAIIGMQYWLYQGSKIIITTRHKRLWRSHESCKKFKVKAFDDNESLQLFSWHAFGQAHPAEGYIEHSKSMVHYCGGLPLVLEVLGSSLSGQSTDLWKRALQEPETIDDGKIQKILRISYDSLQDDRDKNLFLDIACFFIGKDKDHVDKILESCDFYRIFGMQKLLDRYLITIDEDNKLMMHQLLRDMGREIVRQESPQDPGKRSRLWRHKDAFTVLRKNSGTETVRSLIFDLQSVNTASTNDVDLKTNAFAKMSNLKLLHLNNIELSGGYENLPKSLVWLCWRGFPLNCIPNHFYVEDMVVLDMRNSSLRHIWKGTRVLPDLKILDLSDSHGLVSTSDLSGMHNLERLILKNCINLIEVHESIGNLERLVFFNLKGCKNLRKLPKKIGLLKSLDSLILSGCSKLTELPEELGKLGSLRELHADKTAINQHLLDSSCWSWLLPRKTESTSFSFAFLPYSLVWLNLADSNITNDVIPDDLSSLPSLQYLNLSGNPIHTLPDSIKSLAMLESLILNHCRRLLSLPELPTTLKKLRAEKCVSLERILDLPNVFKSLRLNLIGCRKLVQVQDFFNLEPIRNSNIEIVNNMQLINVESLEGIEVEMINSMTRTSRVTPLQVLQECCILSIFLPGCDVPSWYSHQNESSISFEVPAFPGHKLCALNLCIVYALRIADEKLVKRIAGEKFVTLYPPDVKINNRTKGLKWTYSPMVYGVPGIHEDMRWLSHWKFGNQLEFGDQVNVSVFVTHAFRVKKCGVHLVYEQEGKGTQSNSEEIGQSASLGFRSLINQNVLEFPLSPVFCI